MRTISNRQSINQNYLLYLNENLPRTVTNTPLLEPSPSNHLDLSTSFIIPHSKYVRLRINTRCYNNLISSPTPVAYVRTWSSDLRSSSSLRPNKKALLSAFRISGGTNDICLLA